MTPGQVIDIITIVFSTETDPLYFNYIDNLYEEILAILDDGVQIEVDSEKYIFVPSPNIRFDGKGNK